MAHWQHNPLSRNVTAQDPTGSAFFSNEVVGNLSNALIREGIQNNLDECKDTSKPVLTKISLSGNKYAIPSSSYLPLLRDLIPHLQADKNGIIKSDLPDFTQPMRYLCFEDFNTRGLEGDPLECTYADTIDPSKPNNFYFFWRAYGISGKSAGKMGSWGIGKSVFPASSLINTFWAVTTRESDKRSYLIGQSVLKKHNLASNPTDHGYFPYGYYANFEKDGFQIPEDDVETIDAFTKLFRLQRNIRDGANNTGLSVIIPFCKSDLTLNSLIFSVIYQFFYPILLGKLVVELTEEDNKITLDASTLEKVIKAIDTKELQDVTDDTIKQLLSLAQFGRWVAERASSDLINLTHGQPSTAYTWSKALFKGVNFEALQSQFDKGIPIALKVPVKFQPEGKNAEIRHYNVFMQKDDELLEPENYFIREYLHITGIRSLRKKGVRGMVVLSDKDLVTFFGEAEGPAHTGWHVGNFRTKYISAEQCLSFVMRSLDRLYSMLAIQPLGIDKDLLRDFFYIDNNDVQNSDTDRTRRKGEKKEKEIIEIPEPRPKPFTISKVNRGFCIKSNGIPNEALDDISVRMAYARADGKNPFKKYAVYDFDVSKLPIDKRNVDVILQNANRITFEILNSEDFELTVTGFDEKRDLVIDVK
ncbi:MAG: hypothetical protein KF744_03965 [Taibaiella sp.]|nr:hypothetical protein [Taibaiella sp.]